MPDIVHVRGLEFVANHGATAAERRSTRRFRVDVELAQSLDAPARSDRLADTIDYARVCAIVLEHGTRSTYKLLEALAGAIADALQLTYPRAAVTITLEKLAPPCPGIPDACGVTLHRAVP